MASGTAVLASEAGAWKEVVREGIDGYVVPCDEVEATRTKLALLLSEECELEKMGLAGLQRIKDHFTIEREAESLCDFFKSLQLKES
jgi:mannosyltransferase